MVSYQQNNDQEPFIKINIVSVFFAVVEIIFLVVLATLFVKVTEEQYVDGEVVIGGFEQKLDNISTDSINTIEGLLYDAVAYNSQSLHNVSDVGVAMRPDTLIDMRLGADDESVRYLSFIVDVPDIEQSYRIYYGFIEPENPSDPFRNNVLGIGVLCPSDEEMVYDDFNCKDADGQNMRNKIVMDYLGYADFEDFYAYIDEDNLSQIRIVSRYYNHTSEQDARYIQEVREFVESLGISPNLFEYYIVPVEELEIL